jgi:hypothetical protein
MAIPTNVKHVVTFKEQVNHDRYDSSHANCSCGWHAQVIDEPRISAAAVLRHAQDHIARHGGTISNASKTGELRPSGQGQGPGQAKESEPVGSLRLVNGTETAPTPEGLRQKLEALKAANTAKLPETTK